MANTTNNQLNKGLEVAQNIKSNVLDLARELQQSLANIKRRAATLSDDIQKRKAEFYAKAEEEANAQKAAVLEETKESVVDVAPIEAE